MSEFDSREKQGLIDASGNGGLAIHRAAADVRRFLWALHRGHGPPVQPEGKMIPLNTVFAAICAQIDALDAEDRAEIYRQILQRYAPKRKRNGRGRSPKTLERLREIVALIADGYELKWIDTHLGMKKRHSETLLRRHRKHFERLFSDFHLTKKMAIEWIKRYGERTDLRKVFDTN